MTRYPEVPDLIEQYMDDTGAPSRWITVRDIRTRFSLDETAGPAVAGFLQRLSSGPVATCPYRVSRIEKYVDNVPPYRIICRYLVEKRPSSRKWKERERQVSQQPVNKL